MSISSLDAISPLDGRYGSKTSALRPYFSEAALMRYRVWVEVEYFIALCELPLPALAAVDPEKFQLLRTLYQNFQKEDAQQIKAIESTTNHDVKAIEYFI
ncbi:MAG: adenylosuccinate lyase, partial [Flavobacteriaceae bacterium]|nr:adenylosuccinate lyase [Flavobacteriaceae bacterium]